MRDNYILCGIIGIVKNIRYFGLGAIISISLAILNVLYFSLSRHISIRNVLNSAVFALKPAIAEEVIFHLFLLAYVYYVLCGKAETRFKNVLIYMLLIIPHKLLIYTIYIFLLNQNKIILQTFYQGRCTKQVPALQLG